MSDLISRQAAIAAMNRHLDTIPVVNNNIMEMIRRNEVMDCRGIINGLPSAQPEQIARDIATIIENEQDMRVVLKNADRTETHSCDYQRTGTHEWTPVTEALPRDDEEVIVTCLDDSGDTPYSYTTTAWHYKGMWVCDNMRCPFVIAWMPRPEPWKGETE